MTDNRSPLEDIEPLGRSVEEIERESQNRVNPPALEDAGVEAGTGMPVVPPVNATGTWAGSSGLGAGTPEVPTGPVVLPGDEEERRP